ncbi:MAG: peptide-methionine (S)-S-oxide reductase [Patescibacteria group bacterium]
MEIVVFGGGCFWCTEAVFQQLKGVKSVMPGYVDGIEVIRIEFDPKKVKFHDLLTVFFATHDPTSRDRQGADVGPQYRSAISYTTDYQKKDAERFIGELGPGIVTELKPLGKFSPAEEEHHNYYKNNSSAPYCQMVINPKLQKVQEKFYDLLNNGH